ncbi:hypothetical protein [Streptomyces sp. RB17]|uniref:hypothetical protein n=1 Tax=Streptomyces sp. RB17 TaxID=2585197 RepID=UPI001E5C584F|nr:hypothetical protein [Streptomyces sp. RB17]
MVAPLVRPAAPAAASSGDRKAGGQASGEASGERREGRDGGGRGRGRGHEDEGRIFFNERTYSADAEGCITAASGLGASSFSVFNDSRKTIEVFRGFSCDNGAPVAVVGPHGETEGVVTRTFHEGAFGGFGEGVLNFGDDGAVGSFRVVCDHDEW